MACGVPVVAPHVGGLPEVVLNGASGLLFPPGDYAAAARMAADLLADPARHAAMRQAAVGQAARFSYAQVVPLYEDLYRGLLPGSSRPGDRRECRDRDRRAAPRIGMGEEFHRS
jgi:glycosyltransferase involved in cell wall biosynthesis